jgi:MoxR-like ATPase
MQERQVTVGGTSHPLPQPFFVLATQNPIEQEGTYPLPEAQLDRFLMQILIDYPAEEEELTVALQSTAAPPTRPETTVELGQILDACRLVRLIPVAEHTARFAVALVRATRPTNPDGDDPINRYVSWGAGPRASQALILAAKARAALGGRPSAEVDDVVAVARPVLRHRLVTQFEAEADGIRPDDLIDQLLRSRPFAHG